MSARTAVVAATLLLVFEGPDLCSQDRAVQKTGRIEGRVAEVPQIKNRPPVIVHSVELFVGDSGRPFSQAEVDSDGHFVFESVPAGRVRLHPLFRVAGAEDDVSVFPALIVPAIVRPNTTLGIALFGKGRPVTGKIVLPPSINPENVRVWLSLRSPPIRALRGPVAQVYSVLTAKALESPLDPDGRFQIEGVREGNYRIGVSVTGDRSASLVFKGVADRGYPLVEHGEVTIPFIAEAESGPLDLGSLEFDLQAKGS